MKKELVLMAVLSVLCGCATRQPASQPVPVVAEPPPSAVVQPVVVQAPPGCYYGPDGRLYAYPPPPVYVEPPVVVVSPWWGWGPRRGWGRRW